MAEKKEQITKTEAFAKKGGLRCFTSGGFVRKIAALSAAVLVGGTAMMPTQANAAPPRFHHSRDSARAFSILGLVNAGLNSAGALSNITASFLRKPAAQERLNTIVGEYQMKIQDLNAAYQAQVGTVGNDAVPYVEEYLAYKRNPSSKTPAQVAELEQKLGKSGMTMVWIVEACNAFNEKIDAQKEGRTRDATAAAQRESAYLRQARKLDSKLTSMALGVYGLKQNKDGKYDSWAVLDRLDILRTQVTNPRMGSTDQQWLAAYEQEAQRIRQQYNAAANAAMREINGYNATIQREMGNVLFGTGAIIIHSHDIHRINEHWPSHHHRRGGR